VSYLEKREGRERSVKGSANEEGAREREVDEEERTRRKRK
jgi:hypothetical protein